MGINNPPSALLFGQNNLATNLEVGMLNSDGSRLKYEGPKNYIANSTFENGSITGWSAAAVGTLPTGQGLPTGVSQAGNIYIFSVLSSVFMGPGDVYTNNGQTFTVLSVVTSTTLAYLSGTGAPLSSGTLTKSSGSGDATVAYSAFTSTVPSGNVTVSATSSSPLSGTSSLSYAWSAATTANNALVSSAFTIDIEDRAKVLTFKFYYQATTGTSNINWSGTSSNSFSVWIYDIQSNIWIQPAGVYGMTQGTGIGICTGTFQTSSTGTSFQIAIVNNAATAGAVTLYIDDISISPQTAPIGSVITDWVSYSPTFTGFGTPTSITFKSRRVGDSLEVTGAFISGTNTATQAQITLGYNGGNANVVMDSNKVPALQIVGIAGQAASSTTYFSAYAISPNPSGVNYINLSAQSSTLNSITAANGTAFSNTAVIEINFKVPITGWSSNVQMSNDTDTRVISFTGTQVSQAVTASVTDIAFTTVKDTAGAWNGTQYVVPISGDYLVVANGVSSASSGTLAIYRNGVDYQDVATISSTQRSTGAVLVTGCVAGNLLSLRINTSLTITGSALSIFRLSGPSVIAATESVNARYTSSASTITSSPATITYTNKDYDSHNSYSTGTYTIPVSGKYSISAALAVSGTAVANTLLDLYIYKNGSPISQVQENSGGSLSLMNDLVTDQINCIAGDLITIRASSTATTPVISGSSTLVYFTLFRTGN